MHPAIQKLETATKQALEHLKSEFAQIQAGRASPALVENIMVESYGSMMTLKSVATINTPDASTITIQPWDKGMVTAIEKGIMTSPLGLNPQSDGVMVRISIPKPTEEKRKELIKTLKELAEEGKITLRNARHEGLSDVKKEKEAGTISEDIYFYVEKEMQKLIDQHNKTIDDLVEKKSAEIMTI